MKPKFCPKCGARLRRYLRDMECPDANCPQQSVYCRGAPHRVPLWRRAWALLTLRGWRERRRKERERVRLATFEKAFLRDYVPAESLVFGYGSTSDFVQWAKKNNVSIFIDERPSERPQSRLRMYARANVEIMHNGMLGTAHGDGATAYEAVRNLSIALSGKKLVKGAHLQNRIEFEPQDFSLPPEPPQNVNVIW